MRLISIEYRRVNWQLTRSEPFTQSGAEAEAPCHQSMDKIIWAIHRSDGIQSDWHIILSFSTSLPNCSLYM
jgi:hypothetical protein